MADDPLRAYVPRLLLRRGADGPAHWTAEATLVFADVSGFTRLTEKLSRSGRAGGEEIVRTISDVFTILLNATADGGDVVKFSGDALVVLFDGPDHARRACHAALTMQRVLRAIGGIDSSRGRVRLRMSIGVHSGCFACFLCGGDHLELFVLGPDATATVAAEAAAGADEVVVTRPTAARVPDATFGADRGVGVVLRAMPGLAPAPPPPDGSADASRFVAPPLRDLLAHDEVEPEHRRATVAFAHIGGLDRLLGRGDDGAAFALVQRLTEAAMAALDRYGVLLTATDVSRDGGTLMLTAGAPHTTGDDPARMLRVAHALVTAGSDLPVRVGVHAGTVFCAAVGAPQRRTWSTMGAPTNLAARVAAAAGWGDVLATTAVLDQVAGRFAVTPVAPFAARGHAGSVEAGVVGAPRSATVVAADRSTPFVGRDRELATLRAALAAARAGRGGAVEVVGDHGVGKSRLVDELRTEAPDVPWCLSRCDAMERTVPYRAVRRVLRAVLGMDADLDAAAAGTALADLVGAVAPALAPVVPLIAVPVGATVPATAASAQVAARFRRERTHQAVGDLLGAMPRDHRVLVVEDVQHMDDASAELLAALLARLRPTHPWLVVLTRTDEATGLHAGRGHDPATVRLGPLAAEDAAALARRLAEHIPVPAHLLPRIVERAGGSPLFLAALVDAQADGSDELPGSVEAVVAAAIDRLDPSDRRALRYVSVLGDRFGVALLDAVLGDVGVHSSQADRWRRLADFVTLDGSGGAFRTALVREVAYAGLPFRRRRQLHGKVAGALAAAGATAADRAPHLLWAERWHEAWDAARRAGAQAREAGAPATAGELYDLALRAARRAAPDDGLAAVAVEAGEAWEQAGVWDRALAAYAVAARATHEPEAAVWLTIRRARTHEGAGRGAQALRMYRRAATAAIDLGDGARALARAHALAGCASTRLAQGRPDDALPVARQALEHAESADDDAAVARALHLLDRAHTARGEHEAATAHRDRALPRFAAVDDLASQGTVLFDLGADAQRRGRLDEALWLYERSHDARVAAGDVVRAAASANAIGEVLIASGQEARAQVHLAEALRAWRGARAPVGVARASRNLGLVALRAGDAPGAIGRLSEAVAVAGRAGADALRVGALLDLAEALLVVGRHVEAWEAATEVLDRGDPAVRAVAHRVRGTAVLRTGGVERAREELGLALAADPGADEADEAGRLLAEAGGAAAQATVASVTGG